MSPVLAIALDKPSYNKGDVVTATVSLAGVPDVSTTVTVSQVVDGQTLTGTAVVVLKHLLGATAVPVANPPFATPFTATATPNVYTATA